MVAPGGKLNLGFLVGVVRGEVAAEVPFASLLTRRTVVSVYMKNNTPSCDRQNDALMAVVGELAQAGFSLIAISRDMCRSHLRYSQAKGIGYALVSDPEDRFARAAGSLIEKSMYGRKFVGPARAVFVLDRDGTVMAVAEKVEPVRHAVQLKELVNRLVAAPEG